MKNKNRWFCFRSLIVSTFILGTAILVFMAPQRGEAAVIDTATITVSASGSLNTIVGGGGVDHLLSIPSNATFQYFTVGLSSFTSNPLSIGLPQSLSLIFQTDPNTAGGIYWNLNTGIFVGQTFVISSAGNSPAYDNQTYYLMRGLIEGSGLAVPQIGDGMSYGFGGIDATATATFLVTANGTISAVPIPAAFWLFGSGLIGLFGFVRKWGR